MKTLALVFLGLSACSLLAPDSSYFSGGLVKKGVDAAVAPDSVASTVQDTEQPALDTTPLVVEAAVDTLPVVDTYDAGPQDTGPDTKYLDRIPVTGPYRFSDPLEVTRWEITTGDCTIEYDPVIGRTHPGSMRLIVPPQPDGTVTRCELQLILPALTSFPSQVVHLWATKVTPTGEDNSLGIKPFTLRLSKQWADNGTYPTFMGGVWTDYVMDLDTAPYRSSDIRVFGYDISTTLGGILYLDDFAIVPK